MVPTQEKQIFPLKLHLTESRNVRLLLQNKVPIRCTASQALRRYCVSNINLIAGTVLKVKILVVLGDSCHLFLINVTFTCFDLIRSLSLV
jgi:hypothetical protein